MPIVNQVRVKPGREGMGSTKVTVAPIRLPRQGGATLKSNGPPPRNMQIRRGR